MKKLDAGTVGGLLLAYSMVFVGLYLSSGKDMGLLYKLYVYQPDSFALTIGGAFGAVIAMTPWVKFKVIGKAMMKAVYEDTANTAYVDLVNELTEYATEARRNGVLALDARTEEVQDPFLKQGLQLAVDGTAPEQIEEIMLLDLDALKKRHEIGQTLFLKLAEMAPAYGMIGTLVGLVAMLANLSDPSSLGPSMAVALITTLYGSVLANMVCIPVADKLKHRSAEEVTRKEMIIAAILGIQNGDNPRIIKQKLVTFVNPETKLLLVDKEEA